MKPYILYIKRPCNHFGRSGEYCSWCKGTGFYYGFFDPDDAKYNFIVDNKKEVSFTTDEVDVNLNCECGLVFSVHSEGSIVCRCGRAYRISVSVEVDNSHANDPDYWQREYNAVITE